jgi:hypothetical protein
MASAVRPSGEGSSRSRATRECGATSANSPLGSQPRTDRRQVQLIAGPRLRRLSPQYVKTAPVAQKRDNIANVSTHSVRRQTALRPKVPFIGVQKLSVGRGKRGPNAEQVNPTAGSQRHKRNAARPREQGQAPPRPYLLNGPFSRPTGITDGRWYGRHGPPSALIDTLASNTGARLRGCPDKGPPQYRTHVGLLILSLSPGRPA